MKLKLKNPGGLIKNVKLGFSWTTFFFGFFPALFRGDLKWAIIMLITQVVLGIFTLGIGSLVTGIVFSFIYNKLYIKELIEKGYLPATEEDSVVLQNKQIIA